MIDSSKPIESQLMEYIKEIQTSLDQFLQGRTSQYSTDYEALSGFYQNIHKYIDRGGKRIRPLLLRLGYEAVKAILENETDKMIGMINQKITHIPLTDTWAKKKLIDPAHIVMADILSS